LKEMAAVAFEARPGAPTRTPESKQPPRTTA
jgi:hypothetical protein